MKNIGNCLNAGTNCKYSGFLFRVLINALLKHGGTYLDSQILNYTKLESNNIS